MSLSALTSLSPLDGRYAGKLDALRPQFSECGLIRRRLQVEIEWLKALAAAPHFSEIPAFSPATLNELAALVDEFGPPQAAEVKDIEAVTNHDVKALEYWIKKRLANNVEVMQVAEFIHFACTSEDINNLAHALMLQTARDETLLPMLDRIVARMPRSADSRVDSYLALLEMAMLDGYLSLHEQDQLVEAAQSSALSRPQVLALHAEYLHAMIARGFPVEYFVEGGRSRTGRTLSPKAGLLAMTVESWLRSPQRPVVFVPVYIGYERLLEGDSYVAELSGR